MRSTQIALCPAPLSYAAGQACLSPLRERPTFEQVARVLADVGRHRILYRHQGLWLAGSVFSSATSVAAVGTWSDRYPEHS
jgi:hypothetical protein